MLLVRTGGIFGVFVALIVAGIFLFVVRPAINDTTNRAFDTADRALDEAAAAVRRRPRHDRRGDRHRPATTSPPPPFGAVVSRHRAELGPDAELLDLTVTSTAAATSSTAPATAPPASPGAPAATACSPSR